MSAKPEDFTSRHDRAISWQALAHTSAFRSFFLGHILKKQIDLINEEILEGCPPDKLLEKRAARDALRALRKDAEKEITAALTTPNEP